MALYIKDPKADKLARELAARTGDTITRAVVGSLERSLEQIKQRANRRLLKKDLSAIRRAAGGLPVLDPRTPDEIIGYDEYGVPR